METILDFLLVMRIDVVLFVVVAAIACTLLLGLLRRQHFPPRAQVVTIAFLGALVLGAVILIEYSGRDEHRRLRSTLEGFAPTYAVALEHGGYSRISTSTKADDPLYLQLIQLEKDWLACNHNADDIYTMHRDADGTTRFVVDAETDYDHNGKFEGEREQRTNIGEIYPVPTSEVEVLDRCFAGEAVFDGDPSTDRWGTWVSSYAPIHDENGRVIAVVGVDYDARSWLMAILMRRLATMSLFALLLIVLGSSLAFFQMHRDRRTRRILAAKNAQLETANADLGIANRKAMAASVSKSEFLANMSHELRTPLTAILGFADVLAEDASDPQQRQETIEVIRRNGQHLLMIISDILDLSKLESGVVDLALVPCSPRELAAEVVDLFAHQAMGKGIDLRLETAADLPARIATDPVRLRQVLMNLIGNAIKFTEKGSVVLRLSFDADGDTISFHVVDTGIGIPRHLQARLFLPFSQVDSSMTRRQGGTGLGLAISKRLSQMLGGDLAVASEVGQGSTFRLRLMVGEPNKLPSTPAPIASTPTPERGNGAPMRGRILLAEDGPDNQRLIGFVLRKQGFEVDIVDNGRFAIERILGTGETPAAAPYDLVLMDMQMPEVDGYEATRTLREAGFRKPIIAVTAHAMSGDRELCMASGCSGFVTKPIDRKALLQTVAAQLRAATAP